MMLALIVLLAPPAATAPASAPPLASHAPTVEALRARVAADPTDAALHCELAFALVKVEQFAEAKQQATEGLVGLTRPVLLEAPGAPQAPAAAPPPKAPSQRVKAPKALAPCLYTRGRAHEGLGARDAALTDYVASLALRPHDTVHQRLAGLVADLPADAPLVALATLEVGDLPGPTELIDSPPTIAEAGHTTWHLVTTRREGVLVASAIPEPSAAEWIAYAAGGPLPPVLTLTVWGQENYAATLNVTSAEALPGLRARDGLAVELSASGGGGACHRMDGFMDFEYKALVVVARQPGGQPFSREFIRRQSDCTVTAQADVEVQDRQIVVRKARGEGTTPGRFPLADLGP